MKTAYELFTEAIEHWRMNKGNGTALIPLPLNDKLLLLGVLQRFYARSPTLGTLIVVQSFSQRAEIIDFITKQEDEDNNKEFKALISEGRIKIFTDNYVRTSLLIAKDLVVVYRPESIDSFTVNHLLVCGHYKLVILNKVLPIEDRTRLYSTCPLLDEFKQHEIDGLRTSTPVEETRIKVNVTNLDIFEKYNEYVSTSISIFGSLDIIRQACVGNESLNISATQICANIAAENGWHEHLDMSIEYNRQVDALYNPLNIKERATKTYEIIRLRNNMISDDPAKIKEVANIVNNHKNENILIINKRGEFANKVTEYLNDMHDYDICGNYHEKVVDIPATRLDGTPIFVKSGEKAGERRMFGAKAQMTFNEKRMNNKIINCLSANNAPNKDLCCRIDVVIITSTQCEEIESYLYRLSNVTFSQPLKLYSLYCGNTSEEKELQNRLPTKNHKIVNSAENIIKYEENNDFVIVD